MRRTHRPRVRGTLLALPAAALALTLAACGSSGSSGAGGGTGGSSAGGGSSADLAKALDTPTTLTYWTWAPGQQKAVDLFEKKYPKIKVKVVNAGQSADEYTKLQTAIKSGTGGPDVAQIEYFALPQFALTKQVVNLGDYGAQSLKPKFTASAWNQVSVNGGVYGVPQDTGPMAMFYRTDILKKFGLKPPTTWAEFAADAAKIHAADPKTYVSSIDPSDAGGVDSLIWQAGGRPFQTSGTTNVKVNLADSGTTQWAKYWQQLVSKHLVEATPGWTTEWWQGMASGRYAMWITGAWAPANLASTVPQTAGKWRAAPMPQWSAGAKTTAENGGSSDAVPVTSAHKAAAVAFAEWLDGDPTGAKSLNDSGLFPSTTALLRDPAFLAAKPQIFGGQQANQVLAQAASEVGTGWHYLPYQVYANSVFKDTAGQPITSGGSLTAGLAAWQGRIVDYGKQQGFTVGAG
jgi:multiple sugar transport system substrate-binding protein